MDKSPTQVPQTWIAILCHCKCCDHRWLHQYYDSESNPKAEHLQTPGRICGWNPSLSV